MKSTLDKPILVTGASGFVGRHAVPGFVSRGATVHALVRDVHKGAKLRGPGVTLFAGDLLDPESLQRAARDCGSVLHLAGLGYSSDPGENHRVNVDGSRNLALAARDQGAHRLINISSTCAARELRDSYGESKALAEEQFDFPELQVTHFRPTMIYGADSEEFFKFSETIRRLPLVPIPGNGEFHLRPVCIDDAIELFFSALTIDGPATGTYDVAGPEPVTINRLIEFVAQAQGTRARPLHVPAGIALLGARILGRLMEHPPANIDQVMAFLQNTEVNITPTMRDFHWKPRNLEQGLRETFGANS